MAITSIAQPLHKFVTAYNPVVFVADSDNVDNTGFRYLFDIYSANTSTLLASYQVAPDYQNGYGRVNLDKMLSNYLTYNFSADTLSNDLYESHVDFDVKVGETYGGSWIYNDYQFYNATGTTDNGYTQLYNTATTHNYNVGDTIIVSQSDEPTPAFPQLSGIHTIRAVPDANSVVLDIVFVYANPGILISGSTTFANGDRVYNRDLFSYSGYSAFNGVVPFVEKRFNPTDYAITGLSTTKKFLTTCPRTIRKRAEEEMFFNIYTNNSSTPFYAYYQNDAGDVARVIIANNSKMLQIHMNPNNVTGLVATTGTLPIIKEDTLYYDVWIASNTPIQMSEKFRITIDNYCPFLYDGEYARINFLDRLGSFGSFAMYLKRNEVTNIKRDNYNKESGYITNGTWDYSLINNGLTNYNMEASRIITLNSNWLTEEESRYFEELISSPYTIIYLDGEYQNCIITDTSYEKQYIRNKNLMRRTINVQISNNNIINI